jgi:hypothetical protein
MNMLINMHKDLKCNMENLVEKLGTPRPMTEGNMHSIKSFPRNKLLDLKQSTITNVEVVIGGLHVAKRVKQAIFLVD